ncbi:MAG: hypothetical protein AAB223_03265 [Pseudomonadota bacterium]
MKETPSQPPGAHAPQLNDPAALPAPGLSSGRPAPPATTPAWKSSRLGAAEARIEAALDRLDAALDGCERALVARAGDPGLVARLEKENTALQQTRADVSGRLDAAVERLRRALAH